MPFEVVLGLVNLKIKKMETTKEFFERREIERIFNEKVHKVALVVVLSTLLVGLIGICVMVYLIKNG